MSVQINTGIDGPARSHGLPRLFRLALGPLLLACSFLFAPAAIAREPAADVVSRNFFEVDFADLRDALVEAIAEEGIATPVVSHFGDMLARTAGDLGHRPDLYAHAEILTFCSASVAASLATEAREHIALCPLSVAVYALPGAPRTVLIAYRPPAVDSAGGDAARALLARLVARAAKLVGHP
ncbi:DUF302 domain-containing protein [Thauera sp.]|jgi:uncharacterized protein (DUF302 family)|uniref:DUF302 domain-containing protein n=1 Tax=Thauera sp. TaxID=1905334 RepID=UPI002A35FC8D|nr:DUF302 domain-containing protein [Thauera sp.]MDX9887106.1 DUF302 domain-containing protein [Thauera sp.]